MSRICRMRRDDSTGQRLHLMAGQWMSLEDAEEYQLEAAAEADMDNDERWINEREEDCHVA